METGVQFAQSKDGVNIAFALLGDGPPLLHLPFPAFSHLQLELQSSQRRRWFGHLADRHRVLRFDRRGTGMSDRDVSDHSLETQLADLEAVIDRAGLDSVAMFAMQWLAPVAIAYAAQHPERVSRLVLWAGLARGSQFELPRRLLRIMGHMEDDWELFVNSWVLQVMGWGRAEAPQVVEIIQRSVTPDVWRASVDAFSQYDVSDSLSKVDAPTLVVHRDGVVGIDLAVSRDLAARIADARLVLLPGNLPPWRDDTETALRTVLNFTRPDGRPASTDAQPASGTALILFVDIVDSTALTERLGDAAFRERARALDGALRQAISDAGGTTIEGKLLGDGVLAVFTSARQAIEAALRCGTAGEEGGLPLHLGLHAGDVISEEGNVYGGAVNIAARVAGASAPGEVLVSQTVRDLARTSAGVAFEDRGERELKGIGEPLRVWAVLDGPGHDS